MDGLLNCLIVCLTFAHRAYENITFLYERLIWLKDNSFCSVGTICGWDKNDQDRRSCGTFYAFPSYDAPGVPMERQWDFFLQYYLPPVPMAQCKKPLTNRVCPG